MKQIDIAATESSFMKFTNFKSRTVVDDFIYSC